MSIEHTPTRLPAQSHDDFLEQSAREAAAVVFERTAPLAKRRANEPLPRSVPTLQYLAPNDAQLYERAPDGTFTLAWVHAGDSATFAAYLDDGLRVLPEGETVTGLREAEAAAVAKRQADERKVMDILERERRAEVEAQLARVEQELEQQREKIEAERKRHLAQMRWRG